MIRVAKPADWPELERVYAAARRFMAENGNPHQWGQTSPASERLREDMAAGRLFVEEQDGRVRGAFALVMGEDPTYGYIEGAWRYAGPYGTLHRVAADGTHPGFFGRCVSFCRQRTSHLRIDTHRDNAVMRHLVEKEGFVYCGVIYLADGNPRMAYEWKDIDTPTT